MVEFSYKLPLHRVPTGAAPTHAVVTETQLTPAFISPCLRDPNSGGHQMCKWYTRVVLTSHCSLSIQIDSILQGTHAAVASPSACGILYKGCVSAAATI